MKLWCFVVMAFIAMEGLFSIDIISQAQAIDGLDLGQVFLAQWEQGEIEQNELALGIAYHQMAMIDAAAYGQIARETLEDIDGPLALAYHGSVLTMLASMEDEDNPLGALRLLDKGSQEIDEAVALAPDVIGIRILRLANGLAVSQNSPLNRYEVLTDDLDSLENWLLLDEVSQAEKSQYYFYLGELMMGLEMWNLAMDYYYSAMDHDPQGQWAVMAEDQLFLLEE
ncbi:MAG: hypothetical protein PF447_14190 [Spirochaetaceae bacterium]|jgi:hypothetical protein|nr:hypothetical protein [Spirochaetaceae bacterium]